MEVDLLGDAPRDRPRLGRIEREAELEEDVLEAHETEAHRPPARVGDLGAADRVVVEIDDAIELPHRDAHGARELVPVDPERARGVGGHVAREVDRPEVADRGLGLGGDLEDLGAEVGEVHDALGRRRLVAGAVRAILNVIQPLPVCASVRIIRP